MDAVLRSTTYPRKLSFKELDYLSEGKGINVAGEETSKSYVGAFASLGVYTVLTLAIIYYLNQFLDEGSPNVQFSTSIESKASTFRAGTMGTNFYFLVGNPKAKFSVVDATTTYDPNKDSGDTSNPTSNPYDSPQPAPTADGSSPAIKPFDAEVPNHRNLQAASTNSYLKFSELGIFFNATLRQEIIQFGFSGQDDFRIVSVIKKNLIACSNAAWYKSRANQHYMQQILFLYNLVGKYGICFDVDDKTQIYGDPLSVKSSRLRFTLEYCDSTTIPGCLDTALSAIKDANGIDLVVGTFEPSVNLGNKTHPWNYDLSSDNRLTIDVLAKATVTVPMKNLTVITDNGLVIEDLKNESKAAPKSLVTQYAPSFEFGKNMNDIVGGGNADMFSVTYGGRELTYFDFRLTSSRYAESYKRSYMTILDLFGNIGGTVEFVIVLFLLLFHWYENLYSQQNIREELRKKFGLPEKVLHHPTSGIKCCRKHKPDQAIPEPAKDTETDTTGYAKIAMDEISESALNLERLAVSDTTTNLLLESLVPKAIVKLSPVIVLMKKMIEAKEDEEQKAREKEQKKSLADRTPSENPSIELQSLKETKHPETGHDMDLKQAYDWLHQEGKNHGLFNPVVKTMSRTIEMFVDKFHVKDIRTYLADSDSQKSPGQLVQEPTPTVQFTEIQKQEDAGSREVSQGDRQVIPENAGFSQLNFSMHIPAEGNEQVSRMTLEKDLIQVNLSQAARTGTNA